MGQKLTWRHLLRRGFVQHFSLQNKSFGYKYQCCFSSISTEIHKQGKRKLFIKNCNDWITGCDFPPRPISSFRLLETAAAAQSQQWHFWPSSLVMELSNDSRFNLHLSVRSSSGWVQNGVRRGKDITASSLSPSIKTKSTYLAAL